MRPRVAESVGPAPTTIASTHSGNYKATLLGEGWNIMNRRKFLTSTGAASLLVAEGFKAAPAQTPTQPVLMKLGDQTAPRERAQRRIRPDLPRRDLAFDDRPAC